MPAQQVNYAQVGIGDTVNLLVHSPYGGITDIYDLTRSSSVLSGYPSAANMPPMIESASQYPTGIAGFNSGLNAYTSTMNLPVGDSIGQYPVTMAGRHYLFLNSQKDASNVVILDAIPR